MLQSSRHPLPEAFSNNMKSLLGSEYSAFEESLLSEEQTSIRTHPVKWKGNKPEGEPIPWESSGYLLKARPVFALDPAWHAGAFYVQESSSMLAAHALRQIITAIKQPRILDACAAPGGKSTHLLSLLNGKGLLVANEIVSKRNIILTENIQRWGYANVVITKEETPAFSGLEEYFDIIMVDAPCSGEGLFRKDPTAITEWSPEAVSHCSNRQEKILDDLIPALKPGGHLCYSTCTFEYDENEHQINKLLESGLFELVPIDIASFPGIRSGDIEGTIRCWPHLVKGSGFFLALLKKIDSSPQSKHSAPMTKRWSWTKMTKPPEEILSFIKASEEVEIYQQKDLLRIFPKSFQRDLIQLSQQLHITYFGVEAGEWRKGNFFPAQALAESLILNENTPTITLDKEKALQYLRKQPLPEMYAVKGWAIASYNGLSLGWLKVLKDRVNNYLPMNRLLRMQD
jgi:16S rRNA C967 or C1407 C5-methylase (RsmB/RsmF family)/NOL1/NOP2/fmu family ribosome biogenesis protein